MKYITWYKGYSGKTQSEEKLINRIEEQRNPINLLLIVVEKGWIF